MTGEFKVAARAMFRRPMFAATVTLLLAVGLGANILIFGLVDTLLLKPLPVRNPENLWIIQELRRNQTYPNISFTYGQFLALSKSHGVFSAITTEQDFGQASVYQAEDKQGSGVVITQVVAPNYFSELGVRAQIGRTLSEDDAQAVGDLPAVISHHFWRKHYGGQTAVVGQTIRIRNHPFKIAGVLPSNFHSLDIERTPDIILPISAEIPLVGQRVDELKGDVARDGFRILVRLAPGMTPAAIEPAVGEISRKQVEAETLALNASLENPASAEDIERYLRSLGDSKLTAVPAGRGLSNLRTQFSLALRLLMAGVSVLLLAICTNIAGLLLTRGEERRKELAVRMAIGASRGRLLRQLMLENCCLALPGALFGLVFAAVAAPLLLGILPPQRSLDQLATTPVLAVSADLRTLLYAWAAVIASVCFFGLFPAWRAARIDPNLELKGASTGRAHSLAASVPVALQAAFSVLLLAAGALMLRTYLNLQDLHPGFDQTHVASFTLGMNDARFTAAQRRTYLAELDRRILALPGVRSVGFAGTGLMRGSGPNLQMIPLGGNLPSTPYVSASYNEVSASYFDTLNIPLLEGARYMGSGPPSRPYKVFLDRQLANILFPRMDPIGRGIVSGTEMRPTPDFIVQGVVEPARFRSLKAPAPPTIYAITDEENYLLVLYVRTSGNPAAIIAPVQRIIRDMGSVPVFETSTLEQETHNSFWQERLVAILSLFFSGIALSLAAIGLYGTIAYSVERRRREIGIRMAIGAGAQHITRTICGRNGLALIIGICGGVISALLLLRLTQRFLFGVEPWDIVSFTWAVGAVLLSGAIASAIPTIRALHTDAASALRDQ